MSAEVLVVGGTATAVGKTYVTCLLVAAARVAGRRVAVRKPVQSFDLADSTAESTDAHLLAGASGEAVHDVCPPHRWYPRALAPPMAADAIGAAPIHLADLVDELRAPPGTDLLIVETAGGVRSPIAHDGDTVDLVRSLVPRRLILVADASLGAVHAVRSSLDALSVRGAVDSVPVRVLLNRFDPATDVHVRNLRWLADHDGVDVVTDPLRLLD